MVIRTILLSIQRCYIGEEFKYVFKEAHSLATVKVVMTTSRALCGLVVVGVKVVVLYIIIR